MSVTVPLWLLWALSIPVAFGVLYLLRAGLALFWLWLVFRKP